MKHYIMTLLNKTSGPISNIIYNAIQMSTFNQETEKFEIPISDLSTTYFQDNPHLIGGVVENTPIHWEINADKLIICLK